VKRLRHLLEYVTALLGLFLLDRISLASSEKFAVRTADLWYFLHRSRRRIAIENIKRTKIASSDSEADRIARESFRHFGILAVEHLKAETVLTAGNWKDHVEMDVDPATMAILEEPGRGVLLLSAHFGNWEVAAHILSYIKPVTGITRDMNNPYTDRLMKERKPGNRYTLTPKHDANVGRLLSVLKKGEVLALLIDQHAAEHGMPVDFFGIPAATHRSPALLHLITRIPICFGYCLRKGPMSYKFVAIAPIIHKPTGNREYDVRTILGQLNHELEKAIRQNPEQYLWAHRRWKLPSPSVS